MAIQKDFNQEKSATVSGGGRIFWYIIFILIVPIFIHIGNRNRLNRELTKVNEADSGIDVQLTQRVEMINKLVDATRQSMEYEAKLLKQVTAMRSQNINDLSMEKKTSLNNKIDQLQRAINVQLEAYPQLTATQNIQSLQKAIKDVEENLAAARRIYNSNASIFNQDILVYPTNVAAVEMDLSSKPYFEASEAQKVDPKIDLSFN